MRPMSLGELSADGYGIFVYSPTVLLNFLKEEKCRSRKLLTYFDKNKDVFFKAIELGVLLPFYRISCFEYQIFCSVGKQHSTKEYDSVYNYKEFYLKVGECCRICFSAFDFLQYNSTLLKEGTYDLGKEIETGPEGIMERYNTSISIEIPEGDYQFDLRGLSRKINKERESKNFAFGFHFYQKADMVKTNLEKCDNDKNEFSIDQLIA